jgi:hypothetical protein
MDSSIYLSHSGWTDPLNLSHFTQMAHTERLPLCVISSAIPEVCHGFLANLGLWQFPELSRRGGGTMMFLKTENREEVWDLQWTGSVSNLEYDLSPLIN